MERLTYTKEQKEQEGIGAICYLSPTLTKQFEEKLAAYEDTSLSPADIAAMQAENQRLQGERDTLERMAAGYCQAKNDAQADYNKLLALQNRTANELTALKGQIERGEYVRVLHIPCGKMLYMLWDKKIVRFKYRGVRGAYACGTTITPTYRKVLFEDVTINGYLIRKGDERMFTSGDIGKTMFFSRKDALTALLTGACTNCKHAYEDAYTSDACKACPSNPLTEESARAALKP
jgi:hypothetical protein